MYQRTFPLDRSREHSVARAVCCVALFLSLIAMCVAPLTAMAQNPSPAPAGSLDELKALAEKGNAAAQVKLADLYRTGKDVTQNLQDAAKWYRKAADQGVAEAQFRLGELYVEGKGVAMDAKEAAVWLNKAAAQGLQAAKDKLTEMKSKAQDSVKDLNKALDLIR
jgi:uncharacterized protein